MTEWRSEKAIKAAKMKVKLMRSIEIQMMTTLPSALLELYEVLRINQVTIVGI